MNRKPLYPFWQIRYAAEHPDTHYFWMIGCKLMSPVIWFVRRYVDGEEEIKFFGSGDEAKAKAEEFIRQNPTPKRPQH